MDKAPKPPMLKFHEFRQEVRSRHDALPHRYMNCSSNPDARLCPKCQELADLIRAHPEFVS